MDKLVQRNRTVDGKPTSLADIGYTVAGLDDNVRCNACPSLTSRLLIF